MAKPNKLCPMTKIVLQKKGVKRVEIVFDGEGRQILRARGRRGHQ